MGLLGKIVKTVSSALNVIAPIAMFIPGMQFLSVAAMVANVASGLAQSPPNWGGIIGNLLTAAIPMGLGKALGAFKGGTATEFAKLFSGKMSETLGAVAKKVSNPTITNLVSQAQSKIMGEGFMSKFAALVTKTTGTKAADVLTADQIGRVMNPLAFGTQELLGGLVGKAIDLPIHAVRSAYWDGVVKKATAIQPPTPVEQYLGIGPGQPSMRVPPRYNG